MSKVRYYMYLGGNQYYGSRVRATLAKLQSMYRLSYPEMPEALRKAPVWKRLCWLFENMPEGLYGRTSLKVWREPDRASQTRSGYRRHLKSVGIRVPRRRDRE